jgi:hypothetical protein
MAALGPLPATPRVPVRRMVAMGSTRMNIQARLDVGARLKSVGSLQEWHNTLVSSGQRSRLAGALLGSALSGELQGRLIEQLQWATR